MLLNSQGFRVAVSDGPARIAAAEVRYHAEVTLTSFQMLVRPEGKRVAGLDITETLALRNHGEVIPLDLKNPRCPETVSIDVASTVVAVELYNREV